MQKGDWLWHLQQQLELDNVSASKAFNLLMQQHDKTLGHVARHTLLHACGTLPVHVISCHLFLLQPCDVMYGIRSKSCGRIVQ